MSQFVRGLLVTTLLVDLLATHRWKHPGDDVAIALDFRTSQSDPRVVAGEWTDDGCYWRECANLSPNSSFFSASKPPSTRHDRRAESPLSNSNSAGFGYTVWLFKRFPRWKVR